VPRLICRQRERIREDAGNTVKSVQHVRGGVRLQTLFHFSYPIYSSERHISVARAEGEARLLFVPRVAGAR
jgi:hypothetical protein